MAIEVISIVAFNNSKRADYLSKSFGSFYNYNSEGIRHIVVDGSRTIGPQKKYYEDFDVELYHAPDMPYGCRLKMALSKLTEDYWLCLPDDFHWIFDFPIDDAIKQARASNVHEIKLTCRGMHWFSKENPQPTPWFSGSQVISGETLVKEGDLYISKRRWFRNFHEQFSIACNLIQTDLAKWILKKVPDNTTSGANVEKWAYAWLVLKKYYTAYYRMWIPAFHFIDLDVEGKNPVSILKSETQLISKNFDLYNRLYNQGKH